MKPYYEDKRVKIYHANCKEATMSVKKPIVIPVIYVPAPAEVVEACKNANKPKITIVKGHYHKR